MNTDINLSQAIDLFLEAKQAERLSDNTLIEYRRTLIRFKGFLPTDPPIAVITPQTIRQFLNSLDGLSNKSVLNCHVGLASLWTWAMDEGICDQHIVRKVKRPKPEQRAIVPFTCEEVKALLDSIEISKTYSRVGKHSCANRLPNILRNRAIILLLLDTGIRASELCDLKMLNLQHNSIKVFGKGSKERLLPISNRTLQAIQDYLANERGRVSMKSILFVTRKKNALTNDVLYHQIVHAGDRAGVYQAHTHKFRHTFAINFLRNGGNIYALQMMLGHASLEMVKRYLAIVQADLENVHEVASPVKNWGL